MNKLISIVVLLFAFVSAPALAQLPPTNTYGIDFQANNQQSVAPTNQLRLRYNTTTGVLEQSTSGGPYFALLPTTSVVSFGAKCDGFTNDATAFQNAINYVQSIGGTLSIPHGTCIIGAALTLGTTPIRIIGDGLRSTILTAGASINAIFQFTDLADNTFFQFANFAINGNSETNYGIISTRANHTIMSQLRIQATLIAGIALGDGYDNDFDGLEIANNSGNGINLTNNDSANNVANIFQCKIFLNSGIGVYSLGGAGLNITGSTIETDLIAGIYLQLLTRGGIIAGNYFENNGTTGFAFTLPNAKTVHADIIINGSSTSTTMNFANPADGIQINNNYTNNSVMATDFVYLLAVNGIQINGNVLNNATNQSLIGTTAQGAGAAKITGLNAVSNYLNGGAFWDAQDTTTQNVQFNTVDWTTDVALKKNYFNSNPGSNVIVINNSEPTTLTLSTKTFNGSYAMEFPAQAGGTDVMGQSFNTATTYPELAGQLVYFAAYVSTDDPAENVALYATGPQYNTASNLGDTNWHLVQTVTIMPSSGTAVFGFRKFGANAKAYVTQPVMAVVGATYNAFYVNAGILAVTQLNSNTIEPISGTSVSIAGTAGNVQVGANNGNGIVNLASNGTSGTGYTKTWNWLYLQSNNATVGTTLQNSPREYLWPSYWNGSTSTLFDIYFGSFMDSTAPTAHLALSMNNTDIVDWTSGGAWSNLVGSSIASASTIAPVAYETHITGTTTISTITPPPTFAVSSHGGSIVFVFDGIAPWTTGGNIATAGTPSVGNSVRFTFDNATSLWYPEPIPVGSSLSGTLISGDIPVATGTSTVGNSNFTASTNTMDLTAAGTVSLFPTTATGMILGKSSMTLGLSPNAVNWGDSTTSQKQIVGVQQSSNDTAGANMLITPSGGGPASATGGGAGGNFTLKAGTGGNGASALAPGVGGNMTLAGGGAGTGGSGNANGGNMIITGGPASGTGTKGTITVGNTNTSSLAFAAAGILSTFSGSLKISQGLAPGFRTAASTVTVTNTDDFVGVTGSGARTVNLPAANTCQIGQQFIIQDVAGSTGIITINRSGADTINGGTSIALGATNYARQILICDGVSAWYADSITL